MGPRAAHYAVGAEAWGGARLTDLGPELRETSDNVLRDLDALVALEEEKRTVTPDSPRLVQLAAEVERLAARLLTATVRQRQIAADVHADPAAATMPPIEAQPRPIPEILKAWRETERDLATATAGSAEELRLRDRIDELRFEYRKAFDSRSRES